MASSAPNLSHSTPKAIWDETNTGIFLEILIAEIEAGNRPSGHFTKVAWNKILQKFCASSCCQFSLTQLRNKFDNMKKDFSVWEKLRNDETRLGYDRSTNRIIADPIWWRQKIQDCPDYKRFRTHGPIHLELQECVFLDIVATGYMEYGHQFNNSRRHPSNVDMPVDEAMTVEDLNDDGADPNAQDEPGDICSTPAHTKSNINPRKRRRSRPNNTKASDADVNNSLLEYINMLKEEKESVNSPHMGDSEKSMTHSQAIQLLRSLPWVQVPSQFFTGCLVLFKDMAHRVTFANIYDLGEEVIKDWIQSKIKFSRNSI